MRVHRAVRFGVRRSGLVQLRRTVQNRIDRSSVWVTVPPRQLKDLGTRQPRPNAAALTFDDGPDPQVTPKLLRLLESYSAQATFFMCGLAAQRHPELVRAVQGAGHTIGGHTWDHTVTMRDGIPESEWRRQIDDTHALLADILGTAVRWFRPPRGIIDRPTWQRLRNQGLETALWSIDGRDCTLREPDAISQRVVDKLAPGQIILLHDANANFLFASGHPPPGAVGNQESTLVATKAILDAAGRRELTLISLESAAGWVLPHRSRPRISITIGARG